MQLRQMRSTELDAILDLHIEGLKQELNLLNQILQYKTFDNSGRPQLITILKHMIKVGECQIFVAKENDESLGYCLVTKKIFPIETPKVCGFINGIFIKEQARRQGLGAKLYQMSADWLKKEGVENIELYHMINDERAAAFWKKMGFVNIQYNCAKKL